MPKVTVYVREEDYPLWKSLDKKTEFIHQALRPSMAEYFDRPIKKPDVEALSNLIKPCRHGYTPAMCKFAKNGKPCK